MKQRAATQVALAEAARVSQTAVSRWLNGSIPAGDTLQLIAQFFGVTMEALLGGGGPSDQRVREEAVVYKARAAFAEKRGLTPMALAAKLRAWANELDPPGQSQSQNQS